MYVIAGPTASGKSGIAIHLAKRYNGEIINADSLQVYTDLKVLSARPDEREMADIKHHLYGYLDSNATCSVSEWLNKVQEILPTIEQPIFVGGTGFYINALTEGISPIPDVDPVIRQRVREMDMNEVVSLVKDCIAVDPQRLRRALEVQLTTGKPLSYFQKQPKVKYVEGDFQVFFLNPCRDILYQRCNQRFIQMIEQGAIEEVNHLLQKGASGGVLKAIGVTEITAYLKGKMSYEEMVLKAQQATRQYAKRQVTWFRHQLKEAIMLTAGDEKSLMDDLFRFL